jgi:hypothetical protein
MVNKCAKAEQCHPYDLLYSLFFAFVIDSKKRGTPKDRDAKDPLDDTQGLPSEGESWQLLDVFYTSSWHCLSSPSSILQQGLCATHDILHPCCHLCSYPS